MERSASIYGSSSALRGVQLKIGENFKPPLKVTLPVGWKTRDTSRLLNLSYDFSLEEEVIEKIKAEREAQEQEEQAQKLKEFVKTSTANPAAANMGGEILQPTTATTTGTTTNSLSSNNENKPFNYKDFEDNADTPFETVELQCIDNMDALKSVLQPLEVEADSVTCQSSTSSQSQIPQVTSSAHGIPIPGTSNPHVSSHNPHVSSHNPHVSSHNPHVSSQSLETNFPVSGSPIQVNPGNQYPPMYPSDSNYAQPRSIGETVTQDSNPFAAQNPLLMDTAAQRPVSSGIISVSPHSNTATYTAGHSVSSTDRKISLPGAMRVLPMPPNRPPPRRPASAPNENITSEMMSAFPANMEAPSTSAGQKRPVPKPRSKLPPLRNGPEATPHIPPSDIPPPLPPKKSAGKTRNIDHVPNLDVSLEDPNLKRYPSPLPPISPPKNHRGTTPPINDPRSTMSPEEIQFVNQISAMGFPVGRVARAVKNLGCKEREVIEFLISVNDVCNLGYPEIQVEMVLKENSDQKKAVEFLKLIVQFKELGFQEDKIFEALKKSECDSNKTLDILTCAG